ncbi:hypothetical protein PROFUN_12362 [Planoprotostelium fungivorum]|uniref:Amidase domain-containing protein n=1 Tax=Planoprotostelium fungivorum TaxID=1890364 RepID=A0A2P6N7F2_9EUKA|nr:hypothetical protein PROFUN_12362 [Planoprotostelium fungivorum]
MGRLCFLSAHQMLEGFRSGQLSPVEVMKDTLLRVREVNSTYNCICFLENEQTLIDKAAAAEQRYLQGKSSGKLDGIPITIKDLLYVPDMPTLNGSMLPPHKEHPLITPCVLSIIQEGGIIIGKTTTSDFGWKAVTVCPRTGITRNPYDADRITGGSSGGSATAVALGIAPLSIGSDAGGSLRIPAGFCGVVTLKATIGVVPHAPVSVFGSLSTVGPFARDVRDLSLLLDVIAKTSVEDWLSVYPGRRDTLMPNPYSRICEEGGDLRGLRIAVSYDLNHYVRYIDEEVKRSIREAVSVLESLGATVTNVDDREEDWNLNRLDIYHTYKVLWSAAAAQVISMKKESYGMTEEEIKEKMDGGLYELAMLGRKYSAPDVMEAEHTRAELGVMMNKFHQKYDVLITPNMCIPPFAADREVPEDVETIATGPGKKGWNADTDLKRFFTWTAMSYVFNMTKQPAAAVPCGKFSWGKQVPISMQVVGAMFREDLVLRVCNAYQKVTTHHTRNADHMG